MRFFELDLRNQCISLLVCYNFYWKISRCCSVYWDVDRGAVSRSIEVESVEIGLGRLDLSIGGAVEVRSV